MQRFGFLCLVLATTACTGPALSSQGQLITCTTDPGTGVITRCEAGSGSGSGSNQCQDIDEDGDGDPHDGSGSGSDDRGGGAGNLVAPDDGDGGGHDSDGDGIPDDQDCDNQPGEDNNPRPDLPYDVRPALGSTARPIQDAFAEKGVQPAVIETVTMDGGTWRLAELQAGTPFLVSEDDCTHAGNRDVGRDRVIVTWQDTAASATQSDHLDIRYCK
jgi:hypothetical protein